MRDIDIVPLYPELMFNIVIVAEAVASITESLLEVPLNTTVSPDVGTISEDRWGSIMNDENENQRLPIPQRRG